MTSAQPPPPRPPLRPEGIPRFWPLRRANYGWAIVAASFLATFAEVPGFGPVFTIFIKPIQDELGWSRTTISMGFLIGSASGAVASGVTGRLVDRYGPRVVVAAAGVCIAGALLGLSAIEERWHFWTFFGLTRGSAIAGVEIGTSVAVAKWFVRRRGRALAFKSVGQRSGQAILPILIYAVMAASDWRTAFVALAGFSGVVIVVPALLLLRAKPEDHGLLPDGASAPAPTRESEASGAVRVDADEESWTLGEARRTRAFWLITAFLMCTPFVQGATNLHMAPIFLDKGLSDPQTVSIVSIFAATSAISIVPVGFVMERVPVRIGAMAQAAFVLAAMLLLFVADDYPLAVVWALVFGVGAGMRNVIEVMLVANYFGRASLGAIKGFTAPFRAVSPFGPVLAGWISDETGSYAPAFALFAGVAAVMLALMLFASPPRKRG